MNSNNVTAKEQSDLKMDKWHKHSEDDIQRAKKHMEEMLGTTNHQGNANQNYKEIFTHPNQNSYYQKNKVFLFSSFQHRRLNPGFVYARQEFGHGMYM